MQHRVIVLVLGAALALAASACGDADGDSRVLLRVSVGAASAEYDGIARPDDKLDIVVNATTADGVATYVVDIYKKNATGQRELITSTTLTDIAVPGLTPDDLGYGEVIDYVVTPGFQAVNVNLTWQYLTPQGNLDIVINEKVAPAILGQRVEPAAGQTYAGDTVQIEVFAENRSGTGAKNSELVVKVELIAGGATAAEATMTYNVANDSFVGTLVAPAAGEYTLVTTVTDDVDVSASYTKPYPIAAIEDR